MKKLTQKLRIDHFTIQHLLFKIANFPSSFFDIFSTLDTLMEKLWDCLDQKENHFPFKRIEWQKTFSLSYFKSFMR